MSHSPLCSFTEFHDKHVLVVGQGPVLDIAKSLGFTNVTTIDEYRTAFPTLDAVDHKNRKCEYIHSFQVYTNFILYDIPL